MPENVEDVLLSYKRLARYYDIFNQIYFLGRDKQYRSALAKELGLKQSDLVLNLCCGTGLDFPFISRKTKNHGALLGVDLSLEMLRRAKKKFKKERINLVRSDVAHLAFRDEIFDAIFVSFCLKVTPRYRKTIEEAARVLRTDGKIGILGNHKPSGLLWFPGIILTTLLSAIVKIDFEIDLGESLSKDFKISKDIRSHGGLVQLLVGEKKSKD